MLQINAHTYNKTTFTALSQ